MKSAKIEKKAKLAVTQRSAIIGMLRLFTKPVDIAARAPMEPVTFLFRDRINSVPSFTEKIKKIVNPKNPVPIKIEKTKLWDSAAIAFSPLVGSTPRP